MIPVPPRSGRPGPPRRRWWALLALVLGVALAFGSAPRDESTRAEQAEAFSRTVKCPQCRSQSVADSDAPVAVALREEIERRFADGQSADQVRAYLLDTQGEDVLLVPPRTGIGSLVWVLPVAGLVVGVIGLVIVFRRWGGGSPPEASAADRDLVERARDRRLVPAAADPHGEGDGR